MTNILKTGKSWFREVHKIDATVADFDISKTGSHCGLVLPPGSKNKYFAYYTFVIQARWNPDFLDFDQYPCKISLTFKHTLIGNILEKYEISRFLSTFTNTLQNHCRGNFRPLISIWTPKNYSGVVLRLVRQNQFSSTKIWWYFIMNSLDENFNFSIQNS